MPLSLAEFVNTWQKSTLTERAAAQTHFNGLCEILSESKPAEADPTGSEYTFERGTTKSEGGGKVGLTFGSGAALDGSISASARILMRRTSNSSSTANTWKTRLYW